MDRTPDINAAVRSIYKLQLCLYKGKDLFVGKHSIAVYTFMIEIHHSISHFRHFSTPVGRISLSSGTINIKLHYFLSWRSQAVRAVIGPVPAFSTLTGRIGLDPYLGPNNVNGHSATPIAIQSLYGMTTLRQIIFSCRQSCLPHEYTQ